MLLLPALLIVAGVAVLWLIVQRGYRQAEFRHRERMAMIERGMTPPDPVLGDRALQHAHGFKMTLGILMCGLGLALFMLICVCRRGPGHRVRDRRCIRDARPRLHGQRLQHEARRGGIGAATGAAPALTVT